MGNKIKITAILLMISLLPSCIGWIENDTLYERTLNKWASIQYSIERSIYLGDYVDFVFSNNSEKEIGKRIIITSSYRFVSEPIVYKCINITYDNNQILALGKYRDDTLCYKVTPTFGNDGITPNGYTVDTIAKAKFEELVSNCKDCEELDADKIRQLDYELDQGVFPTKTVVFFSIILLYIFYKIYKKKKAKKPNPKNGQ